MTAANSASGAANDQELTAQVCDGGLRAQITVPAGFDACMLTPELCQMTLMGCDVVINKAIEQAVAQGIAAYTPDSKEPYTITVPGQAPVHGEDGRFDWDPRFDPDADRMDRDAELHAGEKQAANSAGGGGNDAIDFYNLSRYVVVETGDILGQLVAPTHGEDGLDVRGKLLPAKPGKEVKHSLDESIMLDGKGRYIAQQTGLLRVEGDKLSISPVLQVKQHVDFGTGNIDFDGDVEVLKGVKDCFKVQCTGNLITRGLVEAATILVGGDYDAAGGMASKEKGRLEVRGNMTARYLDNVEGFVKRDLTMQRELINSNLHVGGNLSIPTGALIGGHISVLGSVQVATLGSASGMNLTELYLGSEPKIQSMLDRITAALADAQEEHEKVQGQLDALTNAKAGTTSSQREELTVLMCELSIHAEKVKSLEQREQKLRTYYNLMRRIHLTVEKVIHPKTCLIIGDQQALFQDAVKGPLTIRAKPSGAVVVEHVNSTQQRPIGAIAEVSMRQPKGAAA